LNSLLEIITGAAAVNQKANPYVMVRTAGRISRPKNSPLTKRKRSHYAAVKKPKIRPFVMVAIIKHKQR